VGIAKEVRIPDIGDFTDVDVIEVLVSAGDRVETDDPLITLESDKATMDATRRRWTYRRRMAVW
jgi:pyruvate/2-oxoglutarate dehydrogenase complex dihydrolipoamide acyltransferase (E2) component